jgi:GTPase involved in cell partitioning and DNA repair
MTGKKGKDLYVKVPVGTIVKEKPVDYTLVSDE